METFTTPRKEEVSEPSGPPTRKADIQKSKVEVPVTQYENVHGKSYTAMYFDVRSEETSVMSNTIGEIDKYIANQIEARQLSDSKESYEIIMNELFDILGIETTNRNEVKLDRVLRLIELMNRKYDVSKRLRPNTSI